MRVLALDGALGGFSVALLDGERLWSAGSDTPDALEAGLARIDAILAEAGSSLAAIDRFAVGIGPGSFTGVRIALSYAKALALARARPLTAISSYDVVTPDGAPPPVLAVVRGRRGIVAARLRDGSTAATASGAPADVVAELLDGRHLETLTLAGNTEDVRSAVAERGIVVRTPPVRREPPAATVARLALHVAPSPSPHAVAPDYGEPPRVLFGTRTAT